MRKLILLLLVQVMCVAAISQQLQYPYPVKYFNIAIEGRSFQKAYMDVQPAKPNGEAVLLLHGKNFNGYYWKDVIPALAAKGYRVIVPDQIGWGRSDKPLVRYSFHLLANNTKRLLDKLGLSKVHVVGHSMGGMLATRFAVMYPQMVQKFVLENPIGLEDYSLFVPYQHLEKLVANEQAATYASLKQYQQTYYPQWKPEYEQYVQAQADAMMVGNKDTNTIVNALTYQVIYEQPQLYYFSKITSPALLIIGQEDRTVVGKGLLTAEQKQVYGQYPALGKQAAKAFPNAQLIALPGVGHIPHIQDLVNFNRHLLDFLQER